MHMVDHEGRYQLPSSLRRVLYHFDGVMHLVKVDDNEEGLVLIFSNCTKLLRLRFGGRA